MYNQKRFDEAFTYLDQAHEMLLAVLGNENREVSTSLHNLGYAHRGIGDIDRAEQLFREALEMKRRLDLRSEMGITLGALAFLAYRQQDFEQAELLLRQAAEAERSVYGDDHPNVAYRLQNLATVIRKRTKLLDRVKALTGEGRMQALVLLVLPFLMFAALFVSNREYVSVLFAHQGVLLAVFISELCGAFWIHKLVNFDY